MIIRLVSSRLLNGAAVLIPEDWAKIENPMEIRTEVRDNIIEANIPPGNYGLFLCFAVKPWNLTVTGNETQVNLADTLYEINLLSGNAPAPFQTITLSDDPYTATLNSDNTGKIMMLEDPRRYSIHLPEGVKAEIRQVF